MAVEDDFWAIWIVVITKILIYFLDFFSFPVLEFILYDLVPN